MSEPTWQGASRSVEETMAIGEAVASRLDADAVVLLEGTLGAGKTVIAKGFARALGIEPSTVQSPTFTIVAEHQGPRGRLVHLDLYRLEPSEVGALALEELIAGPGIAVVEWPGRLGFEWPGATRIGIAVDPGGERRVEIWDASGRIGALPPMPSPRHSSSVPPRESR